jgi:hypothetical protein
LKQWRDRDLPIPDYLMREVFSTTSRGIMSAPTGLGKSNVTIAIGTCMAAGLPFLHWAGRRTAKVLYIDGEMSRRLLRQRLLAEENRLLAEVSEQVREQFKPDGFQASLLMCQLLAGGMSRDCRKCGVTFPQVVESWRLRRRNFITFVRGAADHLATRTPCVPPPYSADSWMG